MNFRKSHLAVFLAASLAGASSSAQDLKDFLDPSRGDLDGDGVSSQVEEYILTHLLGPDLEPALLIQVVDAYLSTAQGGTVDLSKIFTRSVESSASGGAPETLLLTGCLTFIRGDANRDEQVNITDSDFILNYLFKGGAAPPRLDAADVNDTGAVNITDSQYLLNFLFGTCGSPPCPPPPLPFGPNAGTTKVRGLDPTPDGLESSCDLQQNRYQEFFQFSGDRDVDGAAGGLAEAIYVEPDTGKIQVESPGFNPTATTFYEFDPEVMPVALAVGHQRVVYVITNTTTVYALKDTDGDSVANVVQSFQVPSVPIDAVLADSDSLESVVTLHDYYTYEQLVVSNDSNSDGFADAGGQVAVSDYVVTSPRALAVDSRTARIFVAGTDWYTLEDAVYFYQDTSGNKVVDAAFWDIPAPYVAEDSPPESFVSLAFLPQTRDLFILTHLDDGSGARILAARDNLRIPSYFSPSSLTVFSSSVPADAEDIDAIQLDDGTIEVQVVHEGDWNTCEVDDTNADGIADISECFALPDSALKEAENSDGGAGPGNPQRIFCRVRITDVDYAQQVCENWTCDSDHSNTWQYFLNATTLFQCRAWIDESRSKYGPGHPGQINARADWIPVAPTPAPDVYIWPGGTTVWRAFLNANYCYPDFCTTFKFKSSLAFMGNLFEMFDLPDHEKVVTKCGVGIWHKQGVDSRDWPCAALGPVSLPQSLSFMVTNQVNANRTCPPCQEDYLREETGLLKTRVRPHCWVNDPCPGP